MKTRHFIYNTPRPEDPPPTEGGDDDEGDEEAIS